MSEKKEYIERGAALIHRTLVHIGDEPYWVVPVQAIERIPAADVEPVVRCKDCKWYKTGVCDFLGTVTLDDDYCSIGARTERSGSGE